MGIESGDREFIRIITLLGLILAVVNLVLTSLSRASILLSLIAAFSVLMISALVPKPCVIDDQYLVRRPRRDVVEQYG